LVSLLAFRDRGVYLKTIFYPWQMAREKEWHRFISHGFIHADYLHLGVNMYSLYLFGGIVEEMFRLHFGNGKGIFYFLILYFFGIILSSFPSFEKHRNNPAYSAVGASGAVSAVAFSFILLFPTQKLSFIFLPFLQIPGFVLGIAYLVYSWYMAKRSSDHIAHDAHFWGAAFGVVFTSLIDYRFLIRFWVEISSYFTNLLS
jgi:membrane associated rhomboid family serine protease